MLEEAVLVNNKTIAVVVFELAGELYAIDVQAAREIMRLTKISPMPQSPDFIEGVIDIRGHVVAVMDPKKRFRLPSCERSNKEKIMVVCVKRMIVGMIVDGVFGVKKFSTELLQSTPAIVTTQVPQRCISGVLQWDKRVVFLLNLDTVFTSNETDLFKPLDEKKQSKAPDTIQTP